MVPILWHSAKTPNPGTMAWSAQTQEGKIVWADQAMVPGFGVSAECQSIGTIGRCGFLIHLSNRSDSPRF